MTIQISTISFPEIRLHPHYGHKLRGYIGNLFQEKSPLLHNHLEGGGLRYSYPLVQYKIIDRIPMLLGLNEGANLLIELFLQIKKLELDDLTINIYSKNITNKLFEPGVSDGLIEYKFKTMWMALNQENYKKYMSLLPGKEKEIFLQKILVGNILSFYKGLNFKVEEKIYAKLKTEEHLSSFKNKRMSVFAGGFITNIKLPDFIGLGKAVSRGYGAIKETG
jgi:hypothetical protein